MAREDTALTRITEAVDLDAARAVCAKLPIGTLRAVADLISAVDYPDIAGRTALIRAIIREARA